MVKIENGNEMGPQSLDVDKNLTHEVVFREDSESGLGLSTRIHRIHRIIPS